jgi:hypothetical protein
MPAFTRLPDPPMATPIVISQSPMHIVVAIEIPRSALVRHKRFLEVLLAAAIEPEPEGESR